MRSIFAIIVSLGIPAIAASQDWHSYKLGVQSFGPVRIGMSVSDASKALGKPIVFVEGAGGGSAESECRYFRPKDGPPGLWFMVSGQTIVRFDIDNDSGRGTFKTVSGAGIGDNEESLIKLYGEQIAKEAHHYDENGAYFVFKPRETQLGNFRLVFETSAGKVNYIRAGRMPEALYVEGCS